MTTEFDFERYWQGKFERALDEIAGEDVRIAVLQSGETLSDQSPRAEVVAWSRQAMQRMEARVDEGACRVIMTACACHYPPDGLQEIKAAYAASQNVDEALAMLQAKFEIFLRQELNLDKGEIAAITARGWGLAGVHRGDTILATKIPKSGNLKEYLAENDPEKKRQLYCHCPRVRTALSINENLPPTYCYCGAGFYQGIWQEILQRPVEVEVMESVLMGGDVCTIAIHLNPLENYAQE
ncbi:MAG: hypothetical protein HN413_04925 [Chloroflexi bacterium]|jgi:predicted hydrocarbon binding protein|nr:hypothetical protein [Chloroflexota bacterium]